jgi:hypothetical protein
MRPFVYEVVLLSTPAYTLPDFLSTHSCGDPGVPLLIRHLPWSVDQGKAYMQAQ